MKPSWDHLSVWLQSLGWALLGTALFIAIASFWTPAIRNAATIFVLLGIQCVSGAGLLRRIADLQAALDMKRLHIDMRKPTALVVQRFHIEADAAFTISARDGTAFILTPSVSTGIKVEYLG